MQKNVSLTFVQEKLKQNIINSNSGLIFCEFCRNIQEEDHLNECFLKYLWIDQSGFKQCSFCKIYYHLHHLCEKFKIFTRDLLLFLNLDINLLDWCIEELPELFNYEEAPDLKEFFKQTKSLFNITLPDEQEFCRVDYMFKLIK